MRFVLLDDQGTGKQYVFSEPERIIRADSREELPKAFADIEAAQRSGKWLAGALSYELGYALETRFDPPKIPLINLGFLTPPILTRPQNGYIRAIFQLGVSAGLVGGRLSLAL